MENKNMFIVLVGIILITIAIFNVYSDAQQKSYIEERNSICITISDAMNNNVTEDSVCKDYYCYFAPYAPPAGLENKTETLCICDCNLVNGSTTSAQILTTPYAH